MKKFIKTEGTKVTFTHFMPFDKTNGLKKTEAELLEEGYLLDSIPEPEQRPGKIAEAHYTVANGYYFNYVDAPVLPKEKQEIKIAAMEEQLATTQEALDAIIMGV